MTGIRKGLLITAVVLAGAVVIPLVTLNRWVPALAEHFLPPDSQLSLDGHLHLQQGQWVFPDIRLKTQQCQAVEISGLTLRHLFSQRQWRAERVAIDSDCLSAFSRGESHGPSKTLDQWQALLPAGHYEIQHFTLSSLPTVNGRLVLDSRLGQQRLTLDGTGLQLDATLKQQQLMISRLQYGLPGGEPLTLQGTVTLNPHPAQWPERGQLQAAGRFSGVPLNADLQWQQQQGQLRVTRETDSLTLLMLPWRVTPEAMTVTGGHWQWPYGDQLLSGGLAMRAAQWREGLAKTVFTGRMNVLTSGKGGKGNVVLSAGPGSLSFTDSQLPLRLTGTAKTAALQFYASLPAVLNGAITAPEVRFQRGALLRMRGTLLNALEVDEARWPVAGVRLSAGGVNGPLQAILQVHNRQYGHYRLQLAGQAHDFWPDQGEWQWRYWGKGRLTPLHANWDLQGTGQWQGQAITLHTLSTGFNQIQYGSLTAGAPRLTLTEPLVWNRDKHQPTLNGALQMTTQTTHFSYGGKLPPLKLPFSLKGTSPDNVQVHAKLSAGTIGPLILRGRWDGERFRGQGWWPSQPLNVFQPLISPDLKMKITGGTLRAQAAFSISGAEGLQAGGLWVIRQGMAITPDNQLRGVNFSLPFRYRQQRWQFGYRQPVRLTIDKVDNAFGLSHLTADLQGYYPWSERAPLWLSDFSSEVLGGQVSLRQLRFPQKQPAILRAENISLSQLVTALHPKQIAMSGAVKGEFPLWIEGSDDIIPEGKLSNQGPLTLRIDKDLVDSMISNNMAAGVAVDALKYLEISQMIANIRLARNGELTMSSGIHGLSRFGEHNQQVILNYHHQENIFMLWKSLNFGSNLQSLLSRQLSLPAEEKRE